ncbi:MAG: hypothetical protein Q9162_006756, partial [Coniocarpon cinnabarinum]
EVLDRPTAAAHWWDAPNSHVLGGRDLEHSAQGTWLGVTRQGRIALLTNFREERANVSERSRGEIAKSYLTLPPDSVETPKQFAKHLVETEGVRGMGGFSLIFGELRKDQTTGKRAPLGVVSNRTPDAEGVTWVAGTDSETQAWTCALSNSLYGDEEWPKVRTAQSLLEAAIKESAEINESEGELLNRFFRLLSTDTLPKRQAEEPFWMFTRKLRESIFVPPFDGADRSTIGNGQAQSGEPVNPRMYGTQKQTVILVDHAGRVKFVERTLFDSLGRPLSASERDREFEFQMHS